MDDEECRVCPQKTQILRMVWLLEEPFSRYLNMKVGIFYIISTVAFRLFMCRNNRSSAGLMSVDKVVCLLSFCFWTRKYLRFFLVRFGTSNNKLARNRSKLFYRWDSNVNETTAFLSDSYLLVIITSISSINFHPNIIFSIRTLIEAFRVHLSYYNDTRIDILWIFKWPQLRI